MANMKLVDFNRTRLSHAVSDAVTLDQLPRRCNRPTFTLEKWRVAALIEIGASRAVSISGVMKDALGLWIEAHHESWPWTQPMPGYRQPKLYRTMKVALNAAQADVYWRCSARYPSKGDMARRAVDAHLMRHGIFEKYNSRPSHWTARNIAKYDPAKLVPWGRNAGVRKK